MLRTVAIRPRQRFTYGCVLARNVARREHLRVDATRAAEHLRARARWIGTKFMSARIGRNVRAAASRQILKVTQRRLFRQVGRPALPVRHLSARQDLLPRPIRRLLTIRASVRTVVTLATRI